MWSQISWNSGIAYMKMRMMIMMMITTMMALSPIMMIVWNYYCQKKQKVSDLIKEFAKRAKQTLVTYDNLQHRKGLGGHMIVLFALITKCCTRRPPSLPCFCKLCTRQPLPLPFLQTVEADNYPLCLIL